jgi:hypothetical protein
MSTTLVGQSQARPGYGDRVNVFEAFTRRMAIPTFRRLRSPLSLLWWEWGKLAGIIGLIVWIACSIAGLALHPAAVATLLHVVLDFTLQSAETCLRKDERSRHLAVHALTAGALPLAAAALVAGRPAAVLVWSVAGAISHYAVDWTRKFGLRREAFGAAADQLCHVLTILVLALFC